jgi:CheY-like chemotaxis protein
MSKKRILVADDDAEMRQSVAEILAAAGYAVETACDGDEAIARQAERPADILVTDVFMPGRDGLETIQFFRATYPEVPIIAMTGGSPTGRTQDYLTVAEIAGATATLRKPFPAQVLLEQLSAL